MSSELIKDHSIWSNRKDGHLVKVEDSAPHGITQFRRVVGLPLKNGKLVAKLRTKKTKYFLAEFEKAAK